MVSIIVPMYNEEGRIKPFLPELLDFVKNLDKYELILVDDGSTDRTLQILKEMTKDHNVKIISYKENRGKASGSCFKGVS